MQINAEPIAIEMADNIYTDLTDNHVISRLIDMELDRWFETNNIPLGQRDALEGLLRPAINNALWNRFAESHKEIIARQDEVMASAERMMTQHVKTIQEMAKLIKELAPYSKIDQIVEPMQRELDGWIIAARIHTIRLKVPGAE